MSTEVRAAFESFRKVFYYPSEKIPIWKDLTLFFPLRTATCPSSQWWWPKKHKDLDRCEALWSLYEWWLHFSLNTLFTKHEACRDSKSKPLLVKCKVTQSGTTSCFCQVTICMDVLLFSLLKQDFQYIRKWKILGAASLTILLKTAQNDGEYQIQMNWRLLKQLKFHNKSATPWINCTDAFLAFFKLFFGNIKARHVYFHIAVQSIKITLSIPVGNSLTTVTWKCPSGK